MKKKIVSIALVVAMLAIAVIGGTMAYFTDTDAQTNEFTIGNVTIDLFEDFNTENLPLIPAVGSMNSENGVTEMKNTIEKEVYVENTGDQAAYVRVHIAVPAIADGRNIIATTCHDMTTVDGKWIWGTTLDANYPYRDGGNWNMYRNIEIEGVPYKVFVVTYETALESDDVTVDAISKVYMDPATTQDEIAEWNDLYGDNWSKVYVVAEAVQADGFDDAITALNTAFGVPGEYNVDWTAVAENVTFVDTSSLEGN